jgi:leucyl-tRNA---protein transferase
MRIHESSQLAHVQWYATPRYACSYLPNLQARSQVAAVEPKHTPQAYSSLIQQGFRRSGVHIYRPACDNCHACVAVRLRVSDFAPTRSQRRAMAALNDLTATLLPLQFHTEHWRLYQRYQAARHSEVGVNNNADITTDDKTAVEQTQNNYTQFLLRSHASSHLLELRQPNGALHAVSMVDVVSDGLSAVYTFFEPAAKGSPGTQCVAWMVAQAQALDLPYVYLGYWIAASPKMAYKANFQPLEVLHRGEWLPFETLNQIFNETFSETSNTSN